MRGKGPMVLGLFIASLFVSLAASAAAENFVLILDASNSMNKPFNSTSRLDVAKEALVDLLDSLPDGTNFGLFAYGRRTDREDRTASCQDIEQLFAIAPFQGSVEGGDGGRRLAGDRPRPHPDRGCAAAAADALSSVPGEGAIILLSDGEETCGGDPLAVASEIAAMTPRIVLYVVGLDVEATGQRDPHGPRRSHGRRVLPRDRGGRPLLRSVRFGGSGAAGPQPRRPRSRRSTRPSPRHGASRT